MSIDEENLYCRGSVEVSVDIDRWSVDSVWTCSGDAKVTTVGGRKTPLAEFEFT
jgi:hypothetical protein